MTIRTRVAPSPTGDPHVGTAYVALMNYLFAKKNGGQFLLRIEDTDRTRSSLESEAVILRSLRWLGLSWDEGPDVGGPHGPYRQSDRGHIYREHADQLLESGHAFRCFCTAARLDALRQSQRAAGLPTHYDGLCARLPAAEVIARVAAGEPHVVRMKVPTEGVCRFEDMARGVIEIAWNTVDMQILLKSDGMPTYHLANVVDDHLMEITHVIRGEEWISSAPKHQLLYSYFGWGMPKLFHLPLLRNPDRSKLSKRKNPTSILYYERMGYLPQALTNFLGLSATSSSEGEELMDSAALIEGFDIANITLGGPIFDVAKLDWLNGRYLREALSADAFTEAVAAWAFNPTYLNQVAEMAKTRITRLSDLGPTAAFLFAGRLGLTADQLGDGKVARESLVMAFHLSTVGFDRLPAWTSAEVERILREVATVIDVKFKDFVRHMFIAITGRPQSLPLFQSMELLGRDICRERLREAIATLGGATEGQRKAWTARWDEAAREEVVES
ncbi:glutamate--tRNA ligase [Caulobacter sp. NIBR1757]|uniref:glutamate--tRNA ligase n=1 Tax=Caulobacter sp. NIBR1757 TaxID=3016000 RepID=UPI0022F08381|nr:glutamate--tRNA ligase [Caulobacter sp. NIBR1757]WGM40638.1 Glutamate--tRNA ligase [Caulobacter sp. NIBR1757]